MRTNKNYKDSIFSLLFNEPCDLRELYSALEGVELDPDTPVTVNTLSNILFMDKLNDLSFTIDNKVVILIEHQSTINPNMALRMLLYMARLYEKITERKVLYKDKPVKIPRPEFIVLYNGNAPYPDMAELKLSDSYLPLNGLKEDRPPLLELTVTVYNINKGHNERMVQKCEKLYGYSIFVSKTREYIGEQNMALDLAVKAALEYCIRNNVLSKFLLEHGSEVMNMLLDEWNWDDAKEVWQEEAREEGLLLGMERGMERGKEKGLLLGREEGAAEERNRLLNLMKQGYTAEMIEKMPQN
jgi:hypothetical protein